MGTISCHTNGITHVSCCSGLNAQKSIHVSPFPRARRMLVNSNSGMLYYLILDRSRDGSDYLLGMLKSFKKRERMASGNDARRIYYFCKKFCEDKLNIIRSSLAREDAFRRGLTTKFADLARFCHIHKSGVRNTTKLLHALRFHSNMCSYRPTFWPAVKADFLSICSFCQNKLSQVAL